MFRLREGYGEQYIKSGKLSALAITTTTRSSTLPELPTLGEFVSGYAASVAFGICAPKGTPTEIVEKLNSEINTGLADPKFQARLADFGARELTPSPDNYGKYITADVLKWGEVE